MIYKRLKNLVKENKKWHKLNHSQLKELEWAQVYHDSIRGNKWLQDLPLNIGRWAGNYPFFYVLNRILMEYKPKSIIEFGLGESSKFISTFLDNYLKDSKHLIIEQSNEWNNFFLQNFTLSTNSEVKVLSLVKKEVKGFETNGYDDIEKLQNKKFDLYIVDGPFGSKNYSRYDILDLANTLTSKDDFIIIMDDFQRKGEQQTTADLEKLFNSKNINIYQKAYIGNKSLMVITSEKYKYAASY